MEFLPCLEAIGEILLQVLDPTMIVRGLLLLIYVLKGKVHL